MRSAPALAVAQVLVLVVVTMLIGVAAAAPPPPCDGTTGPGCSCPRAGTTVGSSIAVDFRTGEVTVSLVGVTHEGTVVTGIAYGDNECRTFNQDDLVCEGPEFNCECSLKDSFAAFLNRCNQSEVAFSPTSRGFVIPVHANFSRTTYNLLGDPVVSHSSTSNVVHVNTVSVAAGAGSVQVGLLDVQVLAGRLLAAVKGTNTTTLIAPVRVTSKPVTLVPASVTFEDPAVSSSVTLTHTTCHSGAPACDIHFEVALRTSADIGSFVGALAFTVQPVCDDGCPPIGIDLTFSDYFPSPYTRVAVADVEASVDVTTQVLQPVGTSTQPARSVITSRALSPAGAVVSSKIQGVFMYHKQDGVPCDDTTPSTPVVNALLEPLVPWLSVSAVGLDEGTLTLSALELTLSVLATPEYVAPILNNLQGSAAGRARMQKSRTLDMCVVAVHEINPFGSVARRVSTVSTLTMDTSTLAVDTGRSLAEAETRGQSSAYSAEAKFTLNMPPPQSQSPPPCEGFECLGLWGILAGATVGVAFVVAGTVVVVKRRQRGGSSTVTMLSLPPNTV